MKLLETTLRDGSYTVDFMFSTNMTSRLVTFLSNEGFPYIEVGHGIGLNASNVGLGDAAASDEEYIHAAITSRKSKNSLIGVFCIPGIASLDSLRRAADNGIDFVRIGTNVTEVKSSKNFIELAKKLNLVVMANYMKSYAVSSNEFIQNAKLSCEFGADVVYIVDSSGGMFQENVRTLVQGLKNCGISVGFHGHNNLGMAVSNSIAAFEEGASIVDVSLQGIGRSAGNTAAELFLSALKKRNIDVGISPLKITRDGYQIMRDLKLRAVNVPVDVIAGFADFHTSFLPLLERASDKFDVCILELICAVSEQERICVTQELVDNVAKKLKNI